MNLDILKMEIKRLRKTILIGLFAPVGYSLLVMVFYISFANIFNDMAGIFESASIQGLLRAFSMDSQTFSYILSYYVSYNSVYMLVMGIIFSVVIAAKMFSKELNDGTYEFLYANPVSRVKVFFSKSLVVVLYLLVLNIMVFLVGFVSIEALKTNSPLIPWMSEENVEFLAEKVEEDPTRIEVFERDDALFYQIIYSNMENQYTMASDAVDLDDEVVADMLGVFLMDPDGIFDVMLENPDKYMVLFELEEGQEEEYKKTITAQKEAYFSFKDGFKVHSAVSVDMFKSNPRPFLQQAIDKEKMDELKDVFDLTDKEYDQVFIYYSFENFVKISMTTFLAMLTIAMFTMMIIIIVPQGKIGSGAASGIGFVFYFLNMVGSITESASFLKYFTPLSYVNMDVMNVNYQTETWSIIVMFTTIAVSFIVSALVIRRSDLIT